MVCSSYSRRETDILWRSLVGVTFLFCSLIVYRFIASDNVQCLSKSDCSKSPKHTAEQFQSENCNAVCTTKDCIDISNSMLRAMNQTADPCSDFYNFACGNSIDKYGLEDNYHVFADNVGEDLYKTLKDFIETSDEPNGTVMHKIKIVYDSCVNKGSSELNVTQDVLSFLRNAGLHNWPYLSSNFSFLNQELPELLGKLNSYNENIFFTFTISDSSEWNESEKREYQKKLSDILNLITGVHTIGDRIKLMIAPVFKHKNRDLKKFQKSLKNILGNLGLKPETIKTMWKDFITIDKRMNKSIEDPEDFEYSFETIECRKEKEKYKIMLCKTLDSVIRNGELVSRVHKNEMEVKKSELYYLENVYGLIKNSSDRAIANHIALSVILNNLEHMNFIIRKSMKIDLNQVEHEEYSYNNYFEKWKYCVVWIAEKMRYALAAEYVDKVFPKEAEDEVNNIIEEVTNTTVTLFNGLRSIGKRSKIRATERISENKELFSKNAKILKDKWREIFIHKTFLPTPRSFIQNVFQLNKFIFKSTLLNYEIFLHFQRDEPFYVGANEINMRIHIPYGILRPPVYKYGYPKLSNIAKLSHIIGHELGHSLDKIVEEYIDRTSKVFRKSFKCLIKQYSSFELKDIKKYVRGNQTISETFANSIGFEVNEKISEKYIQEMTKNDFRLPGIHYSPAELFYIFYAQQWCEHLSPEKQLKILESDRHSTSEFNVIGTLQNSPQFSRVFSCSKTSYMNPQKKCRVFG